MTHYLQYHVLTFFGLSNANRDDMGRPKQAVIGNTNRIRHSSQSRKRALRESAFFAEELAGNMGVRSKRLYDNILHRLEDQGVGIDDAREAAEAVAGIFGKLDNVSDKSEDKIAATLAFMSQEEIDSAHEAASRYVRADKKERKALEKDLKKSVLQRADGAVDIAMFGRMLASDADYNRDAAVQVSHAFTTHETAAQEDWFSAVDDWNTADQSGAAHIGEQGFVSGLFYQYACVNLDLLIKNLGGNRELAEKAVVALTKAIGQVTPRGKQNSFANHPRASYILLESGTAAPRDLSGAFFKPVTGQNILEKSVEALEGTRKSIDEAFETPVDDSIVFRPGEAKTTLGDLSEFASNAVKKA